MSTSAFDSVLTMSLDRLISDAVVAAEESEVQLVAAFNTLKGRLDRHACFMLACGLCSPSVRVPEQFSVTFRW